MFPAGVTGLFHGAAASRSSSPDSLFLLGCRVRIIAATRGAFSASEGERSMSSETGATASSELPLANSALRVFSALRMALSFKSLVMAAVAMVAVVAGWRICGAVFANTEDAKLLAQIEANNIWPWERPMLAP